MKPLIEDGQTLVSAKGRFGHAIRTYDDGFGPLWIHGDSMGISGIVRAQSWEIAYSIFEDEFFPSANEEAAQESCQPLNEHDQDCWDEAYGYRPNGKGGPTPDQDVGIYAKDLNGDSLDQLTEGLLQELEITLEIKDEDPTPWCSICNARLAKDCHCPPTAENE